MKKLLLIFSLMFSANAFASQGLLSAYCDCKDKVMKMWDWQEKEMWKAEVHFYKNFVDALRSSMSIEPNCNVKRNHAKCPVLYCQRESDGFTAWQYIYNDMIDSRAYSNKRMRMLRMKLERDCRLYK